MFQRTKRTKQSRNDRQVDAPPPISDMTCVTLFDALCSFYVPQSVSSPRWDPRTRVGLYLARV
jgi:hypothetical protein